MDVCTYQELNILIRGTGGDTERGDTASPGTWDALDGQLGTSPDLELDLDSMFDDEDASDCEAGRRGTHLVGVRRPGSSPRHEPEPEPEQKLELELQPEPEPEPEPVPGAEVAPASNTRMMQYTTERADELYQKVVLPEAKPEAVAVASPHNDGGSRGQPRSALSSAIRNSSRSFRITMPSLWQAPTSNVQNPVEVIELTVQNSVTVKQLMSQALARYNTELAPSEDTKLEEDVKQYELYASATPLPSPSPSGPPNAGGERLESPSLGWRQEVQDILGSELVLSPVVRTHSRSRATRQKLLLQIEVEPTERIEHGTTQTVAVPPNESFCWVLAHLSKKLNLPLPEEKYQVRSCRQNTPISRSPQC